MTHDRRHDCAEVQRRDTPSYCFIMKILTICFGLALAPALVQAQPEPGLGLLEVVRTTLAQDPALQRQAAVVAGDEAAWHVERAGFDPRLTTSFNRSSERSPVPSFDRTLLGASETITDAFTYAVGLERRFRSGLAIRPSVEVTRTNLSFTEIGMTDFPFLPAGNLARFNVLFSQPLLKGRGRRATAGRETAAALQRDASTSTRRHLSSEQVLAAVLAYWAYRAAWETHTITQQSEQRARVLLQETETLVAADQRPAADIEQVRADVADKTALRIRSEQTLFEARQNLGRAMGLHHIDRAAQPHPLHDFPTGDGADSLDVPALVALALAHRHDTRAARQRSQSARALRDAASRNLQHALDLNVHLGYTGFIEGRDLEQYFTPLTENVSGLNFLVGLRYEIPFGNRDARGQYAQFQADYDARRIEEDDHLRNIEINVVIAAQDVQASQAERAQADAAVQYHRQALDNERKKFQQGFSTLFNVILFQDRLTQALTRSVRARQRVAAALARLRHETGTLLPDEPTSFEAETVFTVPE